MTRLVAGAANTWEVRPLRDGRAEFRMDATVELVGAARVARPLVKAYLTAIGRRTSRDLKTYVETGVPSRAKAIRVHVASRTVLDRLVLLNGVVSLTSGMVLLGASGWWSRQLGGVGTELVATFGVGLAATRGCWRGRQVRASRRVWGGWSRCSTARGSPARWGCSPCSRHS